VACGPQHQARKWLALTLVTFGRAWPFPRTGSVPCARVNSSRFRFLHSRPLSPIPAMPTNFILVQYCWPLRCVIARKAGSAKSIPISRGRTASARALEPLASILTVSGGVASRQPPSTRTSGPRSSRPRRVCAVDTAFIRRLGARPHSSISVPDLESRLRAQNVFGRVGNVRTKLACEQATAPWDFVCSFEPTPQTSTTRVKFGVRVSSSGTIFELSALSPAEADLPAPTKVSAG